MPELPEVETLVRSLRTLQGAKIVRVHQPSSSPHRRIEPTAPAQGHPILAITRRAKHIKIDTPPGTIIIHLGMTGNVQLTTPKAALAPHTHWIMDVMIQGQPHQVRFTDPRRFGVVLWQPASTTHPRLAHLGPEPLSLSSASFHKALQATARPLKIAIMDQSVVVGVGNIYASEALFGARLHPSLPANSLTPKQSQQLLAAIKKVLRLGIAHGGASIKDYRHADGSRGDFSMAMKVYGRGGQPCPICKTPLAQGSHGQRASFWCPTCQPSPKKAAPTRKPRASAHPHPKRAKNKKS